MTEHEVFVGQKVIHKLTGQRMTVKRVSEVVATCILDAPEPWKFMGIEYPGNTAVCHLDNLTTEEHTEAQLKLFV